MTSAETIHGKSKLLAWLVGIFLFFQAVMLVQVAINLAAPLFLSELFAVNPPVSIAFSCMSLIDYAVPVLAIVLLATRRSQGYVSGVSICAVAALVDFGIKMVVGIGWAVVIMPDLLRNSSTNAAAAATQAVADHIEIMYVVQVIILLSSLITSFIVLRQLRRMGSVHWERPAEDPTSRRRGNRAKRDYAPDGEWDRTSGGDRHDRNA